MRYWYWRGRPRGGRPGSLEPFGAGRGDARAAAPEATLGFAPCADRSLATYEQIVAYLRTLDAATPRMQLFDIGTTAEGRTQVMAVISSDENMARLARYKEIARTLALARGLSDEAARALAHEGKAVMWVDFGLHSSEFAHAQAAPAFAYRVVSEESAEMRFIRDNVVLVLVPNMNPDGTTQSAELDMKRVGGPFERSAPPELYRNSRRSRQQPRLVHVHAARIAQHRASAVPRSRSRR